jgi:hypothetical protein
MKPARPFLDCPLAVAYVWASIPAAMRIEFVHRAIKPDLAIFADTGGEKPETYKYLLVAVLSCRVGRSSPSVHHARQSIKLHCSPWAYAAWACLWICEPQLPLAPDALVTTGTPLAFCALCT